ncbi:MAG: hypothetical protein N3B10_15750, partial [Armatimonadetes bacterium]|nr:hypothetical protein [Armatimonadota bacterium]
AKASGVDKKHHFPNHAMGFSPQFFGSALASPHEFFRHKFSTILEGTPTGVPIFRPIFSWAIAQHSEFFHKDG